MEERRSASFSDDPKQAVAARLAAVAAMRSTPAVVARTSRLVIAHLARLHGARARPPRFPSDGAPHRPRGSCRSPPTATRAARARLPLHGGRAPLVRHLSFARSRRDALAGSAT